MKKIVLLVLLPFAFKAQSYKSKVVNVQASGTYKIETNIYVNDSTFILEDVKSKIETKYKIISKGLNKNYKLSDGAKEVTATFLESKGKALSYAYTTTIQLQLPTGSLTYFSNPITQK